MIIKRWSGTFSKCRERSKIRSWRTQLRAKSTRFSGRRRSRTGLPSATTTASRYCVSEHASERNKDRDLRLSGISPLRMRLATDIGVMSSRLDSLRLLVLVFWIVVLALSAFCVWPESVISRSRSACCSARQVTAALWLLNGDLVYRVTWFQRLCRSSLTAFCNLGLFQRTAFFFNPLSCVEGNCSVYSSYIVMSKCLVPVKYCKTLQTVGKLEISGLRLESWTYVKWAMIQNLI